MAKLKSAQRIALVNAMTISMLGSISTYDYKYNLPKDNSPTYTPSTYGHKKPSNRNKDLERRKQIQAKRRNRRHKARR